MFTALLIGGAFMLLSQKIPSLLERWLHGQLSAYGVESFHIGEPYWGLSGAGTTALTLSGQYDDWRFTVAVDNLVASYHWRTLLDGEIHGIGADTLSIQLEQQPSDKAVEEPFTLAQLLDTLEALHLPVAKVAVAGLDLDATLADVHLAVQGTAIGLANENGELTGTFQVVTAMEDGPALPPLRLIAKAGEFRWLPDFDVRLDDDGRALQGTLALKTVASPPADLALAFSARLQHTDLAALAAPDAAVGTADTAIGADATASGHLTLARDLPLAELAPLALPIDATVAGRLHSARFADLGLAAAQLSFDLALTSSPGGVEIHLNAPLLLEGALEEAFWQALTTPFDLADGAPLALRIAEGTAFVLRTDQEEQPAVDGSAAAIALSIGGEDGLSVQGLLDELKVRGAAIAATLHGGATVPWAGHHLPALTFTTKLAVNEESVAFSGGLAVEEWQVSGEYRGTYAGSALNAGADIRFGDLATPGAQLSKYGIYDGELALAAGEGSLSVQLTQTAGATSGPLLSRYHFKAHDLTGMAEGVAFTEAGVDALLSNDGSHWSSPEPLRLHAGEVRAGVVMSGLEISGQLKKSASFAPSHWRLDKLAADLFGGRVELAAPADIDLPFSGNSLDIVLSNLRLDEILRLYEKQGVSGTGVLNGKIPLVLEEEGVRINNGKLANSGDGRIVFTSAKAEALQATNQQLAMALRLLEDFNYRTLSISAQFEPSGDMLLGVQLWGSNPAEFDGRQVNFNINLEENLYDLFKVLQLTDEVTKKLEQRLEQQGYR